MPLLEEDAPQSLLGVLTREKGHRFSEDDVDALDDLVRAARPPDLAGAQSPQAGRRAELDMLTSLLDRQSFPAVLEREVARARLAQPAARRCS